MKNNKGFAITTIIFGVFILFLLLLVSILGILSIKWNNLEKLVDDENGTTGRNIATMQAKWYGSYADLIAEAKRNKDTISGGLFCFDEHSQGESQCRYISRISLVGTNDSVYSQNEFHIDDSADLAIGHPFNVQFTGFYKVESCGASGGNAVNDKGEIVVKAGKGSCVYSFIKLSAGDTLFINVGGKGNTVSSNNTSANVAIGGANGGGNGKTTKTTKVYSVGSGGGATDIRLGEDCYDSGNDEIPNKYDGTTKLFYGPDVKASLGSYQIDLYGENLSKCEYSVFDTTANKGSKVNYTITKEYGTDSHYVLLAYVKSDANGSGLTIQGKQANYDKSSSKCVIKREAFSRIENRILVAAGGGGATYLSDSDFGTGGNGGIIDGFDGLKSKSGTVGNSGTQISAGTGSAAAYFFYGGSSSNGAGGGSGYYGGGASSLYSGAGGGSSFVSGIAGMNALTQATTNYFTTHKASNQPLHYNNKYFFGSTLVDGVNDGDGYAKISYLGTDEPKRNGILNNIRYVRDCIGNYEYLASDKSTYNIDNPIKHWSEFQIIKDGKNLVTGANIFGSLKNSSTTYKYENAGDGLINNKYGAAVTTIDIDGMQCISYDLGSVKNIDEIAVWHEYPNENAKYKSNYISVSKDGKTWTNYSFNDAENLSIGRRINAWNTDLSNLTITTKDYSWLTIDYDTNKTFEVGESINTGYKINWDNSFKIDTTINIPTLGKQYMVASSYKDTSTDALSITITTDNKLKVWIRNNGTNTEFTSDKNTIFNNEDIRITFNWDSLINKVIVTANGNNTNVRLEKSLNLVKSVDFKKNFELNTNMNIPQLGKTYAIAGTTGVSVDSVYISITTANKLQVEIKKNKKSDTLSSDKNTVFNNENVNVSFKWDANLSQYVVTAKGNKTNVELTKKIEIEDSPVYTIMYGNADYRTNPQNTFKNPITVKAFKISTMYEKNSKYSDLATATNSEISSSNYVNNAGSALSNGINISSDLSYKIVWGDNKVVLTLDANGGTLPVFNGFVNDSENKTATKTVIVGNKYGELPAPVLNGKVFVGWYTEVTGGSIINADSNISNKTDHKLFAHYNEVE